MRRARDWFDAAIQPTVVRRAWCYAVVVGAIPVFINHGDALCDGNVDGCRLVRMGLTVMVPHVVSTLSSAGALRGEVATRHGNEH